jgi:hypothetical protein
MEGECYTLCGAGNVRIRSVLQGRPVPPAKPRSLGAKLLQSARGGRTWLEAGQTKLDAFDPLSSSVSLADEIFAATLKREIQNIISPTPDGLTHSLS